MTLRCFWQFAQLRKLLKADNVNVPKGFPSKRWTQGNSTSVVNERRVGRCYVVPCMQLAVFQLLSI